MGLGSLSCICCTLSSLVCFLLRAIPSTAAEFISDLTFLLGTQKERYYILYSGSLEDHVFFAVHLVEYGTEAHPGGGWP